MTGFCVFNLFRRRKGSEAVNDSINETRVVIAKESKKPVNLSDKKFVPTEKSHKSAKK